MKKSVAKEVRKTRGPQPFRDAKRRGIMWNMVSTANFLKSIAKENLGHHDTPDYNSLSPQERNQVLKARDEIELAARRLRAVAKSIKNEHDF